MAGLTAQGFEKKTLAELRQEIEDDFRGVFGVFINLLPASVFGTIIGIFAERLAEVWDVAEAVYLSQYPDTAQGVSLDNIGALNAIDRLEATRTRVPGVRYFGAPGTIVPTTARFAVQGTTQQLFRPDNQVTLGAGANSIQEIVFGSVPDAGVWSITIGGETTENLAHDATSQDVEDAINDLSFSDVEVDGNYSDGFIIEFGGDDGSQPQPEITVQSTLTASAVPVNIVLNEVQAGEVQGEVTLSAVNFGPISAPTGTLTEIITPIFGLERIINPGLSVTGRNDELDPEYRVRRRESLTIGGNAAIEAIRAKVRALTGVQDAFVFENDTLSTNMEGLPGKSFEVVVGGGDDNDIAETIWLSKPAGIRPHGNTLIEIQDSQNITRQIRFTRPVPVPIFVSVDVYIDPVEFPDGGDIPIRDALVAWGNSIGIGRDVVINPRLLAVLDQFDGIIDVVVRIDRDPVSTTPEDPAQDTNVEISGIELSEWSVINTNINVIEP